MGKRLPLGLLRLSIPLSLYDPQHFRNYLMIHTLAVSYSSRGALCIYNIENSQL